MKAFWATGLVALGVGLASVAAAEEAPSPEKCKRTDFKVAQVKAACEKGGVDKAKDLMKSAVKAADPALKLTCKSCHTALKDGYPLKDEAKAVTDLKDLLAKVKGAHPTPAPGLLWDSLSMR